jgi:hypothetical protein
MKLYKIDSGAIAQIIAEIVWYIKTTK